MRPHSARQRGVTLVEALVALVVLSIGLFGVAGLLLKTSRYAQGAWAQAAVADGVDDLAERLRSTPSADAAAFTLDASYADQRSDIDGGSVTVAKDCDAEACTAAETAAFHLARWRLSLDRALPGGAGWVRPLSTAATSAQATSFDVAVMWFDKSMVDADGNLVSSAVCTGAETGIDARRCCPPDADAPAGVRCAHAVLVP